MDSLQEDSIDSRSLLSYELSVNKRVFLKALLSLLFTLITVMSVIRSANASCDGSVNGKRSSLSQTTIICETHEGANHTHDGDSGRGHGLGHSCHLGHCSFTLGSSPSLSAYKLEPVLIVLDLHFELSDFQSSLFRPPIS